jgi:hypothetical protein
MLQTGAKLEFLNDCVRICEVTGTPARDTDATSSKLIVTLLDADTVNSCDGEPVNDERDEDLNGERSDVMTIFVAVKFG